MNKQEIIDKLKGTFASVSDYMGSLSEEQANASKNEKWTPNQHLEHLIKSAEPLNKAFAAPKIALKTMFGTPNRELRTYEQVVEKYKLKLKDVPAGPNPFSSNKKEGLERKKLLEEFREETNRVLQSIDKWSEEDLDSYLLPHPVLGKMMVREILYFTDHHTQHHYNLIKNQLEA